MGSKAVNCSIKDCGKVGLAFYPRAVLCCDHEKEAMSANAFPPPDLSLPMYKPENLAMNKLAMEDAQRRGMLRPLREEDLCKQ